MSPTPEDRLRVELERLHAGERPLGFDEAWSRAARAAREGGRRDARWALGPAVVAIAAAVILAIVASPDGTDPGAAVALLDDLLAPDGGPALLAGDDEELLAFGDDLGKALFVGETDFIINLELPSWNVDGEGSVP